MTTAAINRIQIDYEASGHGRTADLEARGLAALGERSREMQEAIRHHRSAQGLAHAARGMLAQEDARVIDSLPGIRVLPAFLDFLG